MTRLLKCKSFRMPGRISAASLLVAVVSAGLHLFIVAALAFVMSICCLITVPLVYFEIPAQCLQNKSKLISFLAVLGVILALILPMGLCPIWNGEIPAHRNQYELMAQAVLDGNLYLEFDDVDPSLAELDNPYDPQVRKDAGVSVHWDSAYYNGKYYMYFGIVPVLLVFAPYLAITGASLTTYHATQLFIALFVAGLYFLLNLIRKKHFLNLSKTNFYFLFTAISFMSGWYISSAPALYCTAIASAMCMEIWSLFFFGKAVWDESSGDRWLANALLGALLGALAVGCRPTVAIANLLVLPLLFQFVKSKEISVSLVLKLIVAATPYVVILGLLMAYNYARFDSLFEFGQSYQLTVADQSQYKDLLTRLAEGNVIVQLADCLGGVHRSRFPGLFFEFPVLILVFTGFAKCSWRFMRKKGVHLFFAAMLLVVVLIICSQAIASPYLRERYKSDEMWLLGIAAFFAISASMCSLPKEKRDVLQLVLRFLCIFAIGASAVLFLVPYGSNLTFYYGSEIQAFLHSIKPF